jgi:hypothetical protein
MKNILTISIIILLTCIYSCNSKFDYKKERGFVIRSLNDSLTLMVQQIRNISIDSVSTDAYAIYQPVTNNEGENQFIAFNQQTHSLDVFNIVNKDKTGHIKFEYKGPNGIPEIDDFYFHNNDSIFILSIAMNTVFLCNSKGKVCDKYKFKGKPLPDGFTRYSCYAVPELHNRLYYTPSTKSLHFYAYRWIKFNEDDRRYPNFVRYSIKEKKFNSLYGDYSKAYGLRKNFSLYNDPSFLVIDTLSYVSYPISPEVYCYNNKDGKLLTIFDGGGNNWDNSYIKPFRSNAIDFQKECNFLIETPAYTKLLFDTENEVFYRFFKHRQPLKDANGLLNPRWNGKWSIIIFDKNFNQIGEKIIPPKSVFTLFSFTIKGNLYVKSLLVDSISVLNKSNVLVEFRLSKNEKNIHN